MHYDPTLRNLLFKLTAGDAEVAHRTAIRLLRAASASRRITRGIASLAMPHPNLRTEVLDMTFPSPVGLAAGMDKNAEAIDGFAMLGPGFIEIGTVTRHAQQGNSRPRMFRLVGDRALINRMGFNNDGADAVAERLRQRLWSRGLPPVPLGISIGKSKITKNEDAPSDYLYSHRKLHGFADYFAVNVSSPNTPGLRQLQDAEPLRRLLGPLKEQDARLVQESGGRPVPIFLKLAPDLGNEAVIEAVEVGEECGVDGYIAANTTIRRRGIVTVTSETGGLSGPPLFPRALELIRLISQATGGKRPVIGVGGVSEPHHAIAMRDAGASLVQSYTGFVYGGPRFFARMNDGLRYSWNRDDYRRQAEMTDNVVSTPA